MKEAKQNLKSGKDAIRFFAKYGNTTPIKYIHCIKTENSQFSPYELKVVTDEKSLSKVKEYYTISFSGILHIFSPINSKKKSFRKMKPTEFISLSDWMKESTQFNIVSGIDFFKNYLSVKILRSWRRNVKVSIFKKRRQELLNNVLYCKPIFVNSFLNIKDRINRMIPHQMTSLQQWQGKQVDLEEFKMRQKEFRNKTSNDYDCIIESVIDELKHIIKFIKNKYFER